MNKIDINLILVLVLNIMLFSCQNNKISDSPEEIVLNRFDKIKLNYNDSKSKLIQLEIDSILTIDNFIDDLNLEKSLKKINDADSILKNFKNNNDKLFKELNVIIDTLKPSKKIKIEDLEKLKNEITLSKDLIAKNYKTDLSILSTNKEILVLLKECGFKVIHNNLVFYDDTCQLKYNLLTIQLRTKHMEYKFSNKIK